MLERVVMVGGLCLLFIDGGGCWRRRRSSPTVQGGVRFVSVWSQARAALEKRVLFWCVRRASLGGFQVTPCGSSHPSRLLLSKKENNGRI